MFPEIMMFIIGGVIASAIIFWLMRKQLKNVEITVQEKEIEIARLRERETHLAETKIALEQTLNTTTTELQKTREQLAAQTVTLSKEIEQNKEKLALLENAKTELTNQFKNLANEILEEKSKRFAEQNQTNLTQLLNPLKTQITEFKTKVEEAHKDQIRGHGEFKAELKNLMDLNQKISADAHNLTTALRGSNKTQGNWGEMILETILEKSGLEKGKQYQTQESHKHDDGSRVQPDVIVYFPDQRHLLIDAKTSLNDYHDYVNAVDGVEKDNALKCHLTSVRTHLKGLSEKRYQHIPDLKSPDYVIMFIPIEPAYMLAIANDQQLWQEAWDKNVLLVSPSTLLFVIRIVVNLWQQDAQNKNTQEIAKRGGELYDKLVGFVSDLQKVGEGLKKAQTEYDSAFSKLKTGKGNVIRQAEMLRELGVKPTKKLTVEIAETENE